VPSSDGAARDDAVALLTLAGLDDNVNRLRETIAAIGQQLESQRRELAALAALIEIDLRTTPRLESNEVLEARRSPAFRRPSGSATKRLRNRAYTQW
jgi:hypothetical protein